MPIAVFAVALILIFADSTTTNWGRVPTAATITAIVAAAAIAGWLL